MLIPLEVLKESWGNVRGLLGTGGDNFPRISWSHFQMVWEKETRIEYFIKTMTLCKWSCWHRVILPFGKKNSVRFFTFHFTHYPSYQKGKTVLGTTKASREFVLEKLHWLMTQGREKGKLINTLKSLISGHSKNRPPLINGHNTFPRITIYNWNSDTSVSE